MPAPDIEPMPDSDGLMLVLDAIKYERGDTNCKLRVSYVRGMIDELMTLRRLARPSSSPREE